MEKRTHDNQVEQVLSKTQLKLEMQTRQKLGESLCSLKSTVLDTLPLSSALRSAITEYQRLKANEAKRRQRQFIGRLMRNEDQEAIQAALENSSNFNTPSSVEPNTDQYSIISAWYEHIIAGDDSIYETLDELGVAFNRQQLSQLMRQARKHHGSRDENGNPDKKAKTTAHHLFNWLSTLAKEQNMTLVPPQT